MFIYEFKLVDQKEITVCYIGREGTKFCGKDAHGPWICDVTEIENVLNSLQQSGIELQLVTQSESKLLNAVPMC